MGGIFTRRRQAGWTDSRCRRHARGVTRAIRSQPRRASKREKCVVTTPVRRRPDRLPRSERPVRLRFVSSAPAAAMATMAAAVPCAGRVHSTWGSCVSAGAPAPLRAAAPRQAPRPLARGVTARGASDAASACGSRLACCVAGALPPTPLQLAPRRRRAARPRPAPHAASVAAAAGAGAGASGPRAAAAASAAPVAESRRLFAPLDGLWGKLLPMSSLFFFMAFANSVLDRRAPPARRPRGCSAPPSAWVRAIRVAATPLAHAATARTPRARRRPVALPEPLPLSADAAFSSYCAVRRTHWW